MAKKLLMLALVALLGAAAQTSQAEEASIAQGKKLFNDQNLGGTLNPTSCNSCHREGKGLEKAGARADLAAMINICIEQSLQGERLDEHSQEMESLLLYIRSLGK